MFQACQLSFVQREPRPSVWHCKERSLGWGFENPTLSEGSTRKTHGADKYSSRNVRHKQPVGHALLEMSDHCAVIRFLPPHHYFLRYSFLPIRPKCDCGHRLSFSPSLSLATATSDLGPGGGHGTETRETHSCEVIRQGHDEARAGNDHRGSLVDRAPHR